MKSTTTSRSHAPENVSAGLTIRIAAPADAPQLARLAQLDSAPPPKPVPILVAEVAGELRAALPLDGGPAIANPFHRTAELIPLLAARALEVEAPGRRLARRRRRRLRGGRPAHAFRI